MSPGFPSDEIRLAVCCPPPRFFKWRNHKTYTNPPTHLRIHTTTTSACFAKQHTFLHSDNPHSLSVSQVCRVCYISSPLIKAIALVLRPLHQSTPPTSPSNMAAIIATNSQRWIASQLSATAGDTHPPRTEWHYVRDCNGKVLIDPVVGFYFNPPPNAKCRWSTDNGARPPQLLTKGFLMPKRALVLWNDERLEFEAARIREKYWDEMKTLVAPQRFEDLYEYFDSATLYMSGVANLWNLINLLTNDARQNWREVEKQVASECNNWVLDWLNALPGAASNRESLVKWDQKSDILTAVTSQFDWDNDLKALDLVGQNFLRECFLHHFERLTGNKPNVARFNTHAAENKPMPVQNPVIMAAGNTAKPSTSKFLPFLSDQDYQTND